jgi:hypothetical protein
MKPESESLLKEALEMPPIESTLVGLLLASLYSPDDAINEAWRKEVAARLRAYRSGTVATVSEDDVLAEYRRKREFPSTRDSLLSPQPKKVGRPWSSWSDYCWGNQGDAT